MTLHVTLAQKANTVTGHSVSCGVMLHLELNTVSRPVGDA